MRFHCAQFWFRLLLASDVSAGPAAYGMCHAGCASIVMACYSAAGFTWGATMGVSAPASMITCNSAFGTCPAACASVLPAAILWELWNRETFPPTDRYKTEQLWKFDSWSGLGYSISRENAMVMLSWKAMGVYLCYFRAGLAIFMINYISDATFQFFSKLTDNLF